MQESICRSTVNSNPLISIIVPVYNVEKYINNCVSSLVNQNYQNVEIILIDDGSTDDSGNLCDKWAKKDSRIKAFHYDNQGQAMARNIGLDKASGEFIAFVDSDDEVSDVMYELMYECMIQHDADVVSCDHTVVRANLFHGNYTACRYQVINEPLKHYLNQEGHSVWRRLYSSALFADIRFENIKHDEDVLIMYEIMKKSKKSVCINEALYFWNQEPSSLSRGKVKSLINRSMEVYERSLEEYPDVADYAKIRALQSSYRTFTRILRFGLDTKLEEDFLVSYKKELKFLRKNLPLINISPQFSWKDICKIIAVQFIIPLYARKLK